MPDKKTAKKLARLLIRQGLAACVSVRDGFESVYRWKGRVESTKETLVLIKTLRSGLPKIKKAIRACHPYEVPELIFFKADGVSSDYMNWVRGSLK